MTSKAWLQSYGQVPSEIDPDRYPSVTFLMEQAMRTYASRTAFHSFAAQLSYGQMDELSAAFCAFLQNKLGVQKGDRVAVMMPNLAAFPVAFLGIIRAGAILVSVNPMYTPRELQHQLQDAGCKTMVIFNGATPVLAEIAQAVQLAHVVTVKPGDALGLDLPSPPVDERLVGTIGMDQALEEGRLLQRRPVTVTGSDVLLLQYTGGTTGLSKGATLSHRNLVANTEQFKAIMGSAIHPGDEVLVTALPLYHIFALMVNFITYFSVGAENWLVTDPRQMDSLVDTLKQARPTMFTGVNTLFAGLTQHPRLNDIDWSRLRFAGGGGSAVLKVTSDRWQASTCQIIREGYGLSETGPVLTFNPFAIEQFSGTTGVPLPSTDIVLLDDDGAEVDLGQAGEVCAKGPQVMSGYWQQPEVNAQAFTPDGYFKTGDIGVFTEQGFLKIVDRKKDMILVSGFNVFPNEVEAIASACPGVAECACIGVPDDKTGEAVWLYVVRSAGSSVSENEVIAHCRSAMTAYKTPRHVVFVPALPKSTVGKILRRQLRDAEKTA